MVQTRPTKKRHQLTRLQSEQKRHILCHCHHQRTFQSEMEKRMYQGTWIQTHNRQTHHLKYIICQRISIAVNKFKKKAIKRKSVIKTIKMTPQTHCQAILIRPTTVTIDASNIFKKNHRKTHPLKLCASLTPKFLMTAYKSKIIRFKLDDDPIQCRIFFSHL